jgi:hypothetical protein
VLADRVARAVEQASRELGANQHRLIAARLILCRHEGPPGDWHDTEHFE